MQSHGALGKIREFILRITERVLKRIERSSNRPLPIGMIKKLPCR
ncbi:MAG: hypothetical protein OEU91_00105 [Gammaproteobacteria bacterium]|nr:hypothetical protein [Gammaproteobacteria bacterium]